MRAGARRAALLLLLLLPWPPGAADAAAAQDAGAAPGTVGIRLLDAPVERAQDPRARTYIVDHLALGATITRRVEVSNTTSEAQPLRLYAAGAAVTDAGWTVLEGRRANELSAMVTVAPERLTLAPGETRTATVTVRVPADASQREHYGVVWAELARATGGVTVVNRVGVRLYVSIGSGAEPPSDFTVDTLTAARGADGAPEIRATVTNTGGRALDLTGELTLSDGPGGLSAGPFATTTVATLAIGDAAPVRVSLDPALPAGPWTARMTVRSSRLERTAQATIVFPDRADTTAEPVAAAPVGRDRGLAVVGGGAVLLLVGLFLLLVLRRRRRDDADGDADAGAGRRPLVRAR